MMRSAAGSSAGSTAGTGASGGSGGTTTTLESDQIWHDGQIIGVVVADTYEAAREAAFRVRVHYARETPAATFDKVDKGKWQGIFLFEHRHNTPQREIALHLLGE